MHVIGKDFKQVEGQAERHVSMTMKAKDEFFTTRSFIEKLTDARTLVNRKRFSEDEPMLDEVCAQDFCHPGNDG